MKLRRISVENVRSFLDVQTLTLDGDIGMLVGPNGGGKTNMLDTITAFVRGHLLRPYSYPLTGDPPRTTARVAESFAAAAFEKHALGSARPTAIEVEIEVTPRDVANIATLVQSREELDRNIADRKYQGFNTKLLGIAELSEIAAGDRYTYRLQDNSLTDLSGAKGDRFRSYLSVYEPLAMVKTVIDKQPLSLPFVYLPVNRAINGIPTSIAISSYNDADAKRAMDGNWSRQTSSIQQVALGRIFRQKRMSMEPPESVFYMQLDGDGSLSRLGDVLASLGYSWRIETTNADTNEYELRLLKGGVDFNIGRASSGEQELLTYVLAVYGLNLRDALIVVDEPELHLHPKWQQTLIGLFERLSVDTGNQFIMATHSPSFVTPKTLPYVSRVYSDLGASRVVKLSSAVLPNQKHLLAMVNSQQNEKIFFSDMVVMVEGISDRIFLEKVADRLFPQSARTRLVEFVDVGGKSVFDSYAALLDACGVPHKRVADLDYVTNLDGGIGSLFLLNQKKIKDAIDDAATNMDGAAIVNAIDQALASRNVDLLSSVWTYVKTRRRKLRSDLAHEEQVQLDDFIAGQRSHGTYILKLGSLEDYLPDGLRAKDIDKLVTFLEQPDWWDQLTMVAKQELTEIVHAIFE